MDTTIEYAIRDLSSLKGITASHWNARSLKKNIDDTTRFLLESDVEILGISESRLHDGLGDEMFNVEGYILERQDRTKESGKKCGGGVAVYYKNSLKYELLSEFSTCTPHVESLWLRVNLTSSNPVIYGILYRPLSGCVNTSLNNLEEIMMNIQSQMTCEFTLMGDMNVNWDKTSDIKTKRYKEFMCRFNQPDYILDSCL